MDILEELNLSFYSPMTNIKICKCRLQFQTRLAVKQFRFLSEIFFFIIFFVDSNINLLTIFFFLILMKTSLPLPASSGCRWTCHQPEVHWNHEDAWIYLNLQFIVYEMISMSHVYHKVYSMYVIYLNRYSTTNLFPSMQAYHNGV